jgi:hypothetical protein
VIAVVQQKNSYWSLSLFFPLKWEAKKSKEWLAWGQKGRCNAMFSTTCFVLLFLGEQRMFWNIAMSLWNIPIVPLHLLKLNLKLLLALLLWRGHITVHCMLVFSVLPSFVWILWFCEQSNPQFRFFERKGKKSQNWKDHGIIQLFQKVKESSQVSWKNWQRKKHGVAWQFFSLLFYLFCFCEWQFYCRTSSLISWEQCQVMKLNKQAPWLLVGVWCHFWYPHNTGTSPSCCLSKGVFRWLI